MWTWKCNFAFEEFKCRLISTPAVDISYGPRDMAIYTDTSDRDLACALTEHGMVVAYTSRQFRPYKLNYSTNELELAVLIYALKI